MKLYQRFAYYLFGMGIGLVFLFMILNGRDMSCSYFPNARVLKNIRSKPFIYSDIVKQKLNEKWVDTADIRNTLTFGDVDFGKSNINTEGGKLYVVEGRTAKNQPIILEVVNYDEKAVLRDIRK